MNWSRDRSGAGHLLAAAPRLYEEGPAVKRRFGLAVVKDRDKVAKIEQRSSLYRLLAGGPGVMGAGSGCAIPKGRSMPPDDERRLPELQR
jgi:hypothetical protein